MRIRIRVTPNARRNEIIQEGDVFKVRLAAPASEGRANKALIEALAEFFDAKKDAIVIVSGRKSRNKIIELCE